jgi:hypothetical protein
MKKIIFYIIELSILISIAYAESLWDDSGKNIYSNKVSYKNGDSVKIIIDEQQKIKYKSSTDSRKADSVSINGGEYSALFNFLPNGTSTETKNGNDEDEFHLNGTIVASITSVNDNTVTLVGRKTLSLNNKTSLMEMSGTANMSSIKSGTIVSSDIQNLSLRVSTLLFNENDIINGDDIVERLRNPDATDDDSTETVISDEKRKEMFLRYVNKLLNVVY